jgi:hypothetical protein
MFQDLEVGVWCERFGKLEVRSREDFAFSKKEV